MNILNTRFGRKLLATVALPLLVLLGFCLGIIFYSAEDLAARTSQEAGISLEKLHTDLQMATSARLAARMAGEFERHARKVRLLAAAAQEQIDGVAGRSDARTQHAIAPDDERLVYNAERHWAMNTRGETDVAIAIWGYLHDGAKPNRAAQDHVRETTPTRRLMQVIQQTNPGGNLYRIGPRNAPVLTLSPWSPAAEMADRHYPGHNDSNFWDFYFPGLLEDWETRLRSAGFGQAGDALTVIPPYDDAGGAGPTLSLLMPLWNRERTESAGAIGFDFLLRDMLDIVSNENKDSRGFAFVVNNRGRILSFDGEMLERLGMAAVKHDGGGVAFFEANLLQAASDGMAGMLESQDEHLNGAVRIAGRSYRVSLSEIMHVNEWHPGGMQAGKLYVASLVPEEAIFALRQSLLGNIEDVYARSVIAQIALAVALFCSVVVAAVFFSMRQLRQIENLHEAVNRLRSKDYDAAVEVTCGDELGELAFAFNVMMKKLRDYQRQLIEYAETLEAKVRERTETLDAANRNLERISNTDFLTGLSNRRHLMEKAVSLLHRRQPQPDRLLFFTILFDVDCFKAYNDAYGHLAGDECLRSIAGIARQCIREKDDLVARYGGEEFLVIGKTASLMQATAIAERIRAGVLELCIPHAASPTGVVSVSVGVVVFGMDTGMTLEDIFKAVDAAMYESKKAGRNCVTARSLDG